MAAGEDQPQAVVLDRLGVGLVFRSEGLGVVFFQRIEARAAPDRVDRLEAPGRDEPGARIAGNAFVRPLLERRAEGVGERLLREVEVAKQAHQRGKHTPRFGAVDGRDLLLHCYSGWMPASRIALPQTWYCSRT